MKKHHPFTILAFSLIAVGIGGGSLWALSYGVRVALNEASPQASVASAQGAPGARSKLQQAAEPLSAGVLPKTQSPSLDIMMAGDVMFDRGVRQLGERYGYDSLLADIAPLFRKADIVVANLEGPITSSSSKTFMADGSFGKDLSFTFATGTAAVLARAGIGIVSLANNHTDNYGMSGFKETEKWLDAAGVGRFGDPWNEAGTEKVVSENGITVAFVGYHAFQPGFKNIVADVKRLSAAGDFVIVMPHWGVEYSATSTGDMKAKARELVAAGAKAVIGSHPHVIGQHEWIGSVPVYYSLGNLLFDQYFSPETMKGNVVELHLVKGGNGVSLDSLNVYETSTASKRGATFTQDPVSDNP